MRELAAGCVLCVLLTGCTIVSGETVGYRSIAGDQKLPARTLISDVPILPGAGEDEPNLCGPISAAMILRWSGVDVSPAELAPLMMSPEKGGTITASLVSACRRSGRLVVIIPPNVGALLAEIAAGHPVLILQNRGLSWYPIWHYSVAIGFDLDRSVMVLSSGEAKGGNSKREDVDREEMEIAPFENTWARADHWGMLVLPPEELPITVSVREYLGAVAAFERSGHIAEARTAYAAASKRWPAEPLPALGVAMASWNLGELDRAATEFERAVTRFPDNEPLANNYAEFLYARGELGAALRTARRAVELNGPFHRQCVATFEKIAQSFPG